MNGARSILKRILKWLAAALALLVLCALALVVVLWPPDPLTTGRRELVLRGVTVINPGLNRLENQRIWIRGTSIESITNETSDPPPAAAAAHSRNAYVLPGLIDLHVHHPPARAVADTHLFALLYLAHGVTAVRDTGNFDGAILGIRAAINAGEHAGPRIFACGPIIDGDPPVWPGSKVATDAATAEREAEQIAAQGFDCIKVYQRLNADALAGARTVASRHGLPLVGHVPSAVPFAEAHLDDVQHLTGISVEPAHFSNREPASLIQGLLTSWETLDATRVASAVHASITQRIAHTPTIFVMDQLSRLNEHARLAAEPAARMLPRYYRELFWRHEGFSGPWPDGQTIRANFRSVVRRLYEAGVTIRVGSDVLNPFVVPGTAMHAEMRNLTECGLTPEQVWAAATRGNGAALPVEKLGILTAGAPADALVFTQDPTRDLAALTTLEAVIADGRFYTKEELDAAVARYRGHFETWWYDRITMLLVEATARAMIAPRPPEEQRSM